MDFNLSNIEVGNAQGHWPTQFGVAVREIWMDQNQLVFEGKTSFLVAIDYIVNGQFQTIERELLLAGPIFIEDSHR